MSKKVYPITENYVSDWSVLDALRELVSNGMDSEKQCDAPFVINYNHAAKELILKNKNTKLSHLALYLGESSKKDQSQYIGQYGEGLKLAFLVLSRANIDIVVNNGTEETWYPKIERDDNGVRCLVIDIKKAKRQRNDVEIKVQGIEGETYEDLKNLFLKLKNLEPTFKTPYGEVFTEHKDIYVKGVKVRKSEGMCCGYNLYNLDIGRDRSTPDNYLLLEQIGKIWAELSVNADSNATEKICELFEDGNLEAQAFYYYRPDSIIQTLVERFKEKNGDAIPVRSTEEVEKASSLGFKSVIVNEALYRLISLKLLTLKEATEQRKFDILKIYTVDEFTEEEKANYIKVTDTLKRATNKDSLNISIVDFKDTELKGTYKDGDITVVKSLLTNPTKFMVVAIHELAHVAGADGTYAHAKAIENLTEKVLSCLL